MFCVNCGATLAADGRYCPSCGQPAPADGAGPAMSPAMTFASSPAAAGGASAWATTEYAGFLKRFAAVIIDWFILWIGAFVAVALNQDVGILIAIVGWWLYFALQESSPRQATLGKRALGIIVTDLHGERLTFARATGRFFAKYFSSILFGIGYIIAAFTARKQALHDLIASTLVVNK